MGLTLIAILTAALLLPGIVGARAFYGSAETNEMEVPTPPLSTSEGIALVGTMSVIVHLVYATGLRIVAAIPPRVSLPLADPYTYFAASPPSATGLDAAFALFSGLVFLCALAAPIGRIAGLAVLKRGDKSRFYGPLSEIIQQAAGDDRFIVAYVISKIEKDDKLVGYQGTVVSLFRDEDRYPSKVILKDVAPFYLKLDDDAPRRHETTETIDILVLTSAEWHNIAFRVYRVET